MIRNGVITYEDKDSILTWRFSSDVINELVIAALLTILSYQLSEALINLYFGIKKRGQARLRDIQIMLLIRKFSPISFLRAAPWCWWCCRRRNRNANDDEGDEELAESQREESAWQPRAYIKLITLILAIPLINIGTVVLSLERDTILTLADGRFGGLTFARVTNDSVSEAEFFPLTKTEQSQCEGVALQTNPAEFAIAQFFSCVVNISQSGTGENALRNDSIGVTIRRSSEEIVSATVQIASRRVNFGKRAMILSRAANDTLEENRAIFFIQNSLAIEDGEFLLNRAMESARTHCDSTEGPPKVRRTEEDNGEWSLLQLQNCTRESEIDPADDLKNAVEVARDLLGQISFVNSDQLLVRDGDEEEEQILTNNNFTFLERPDLLLLRRQRAFVSVPILAITAVGALIIRIITELVTRNDLERGIGLIVRDGLGLPCCDSMLCSSDVVARYSRRGNILYSIERQPSDPQGAPGENEGNENI